MAWGRSRAAPAGVAQEDIWPLDPRANKHTHTHTHTNTQTPKQQTPPPHTPPLLTHSTHTHTHIHTHTHTPTCPLLVELHELLGDLGCVECQPEAGYVQLGHQVLQHLLQGEPP